LHTAVRSLPAVVPKRRCSRGFAVQEARLRHATGSRAEWPPSQLRDRSAPVQQRCASRRPCRGGCQRGLQRWGASTALLNSGSWGQVRLQAPAEPPAGDAAVAGKTVVAGPRAAEWRQTAARTSPSPEANSRATSGGRAQCSGSSRGRGRGSTSSSVGARPRLSSRRPQRMLHRCRQSSGSSQTAV
jgi:hypothetical protein